MCVSGISVLVVLVKRLSQARQVDSHMCVSGISEAPACRKPGKWTVICVLVVLEAPVASQASGQSYVC